MDLSVILGAYKEANNLLKEKDIILVKASHGIALDKVVEFLK